MGGDSWSGNATFVYVTTSLNESGHVTLLGKAFDFFEGNAIDMELWMDGAYSTASGCSVSGGKLYCANTATRENVGTYDWFDGDYNVTVDWENISTSGSAEFSLMLCTGDDSNCYLIKYIDDVINQYIADYKEGGVWSGSASAVNVYGQDRLFGKFRISKVGSTYNMMYYNASGWIVLKTRTGGVSNPLQVILDGKDRTPNNAYNVSWDNLIVTPFQNRRWWNYSVIMDDIYRYSHPLPYQLQNGDLIVLYDTNETDGTYDYKYKISKDNGATWERYVRNVDDTANSIYEGSAVQLPDGKLLVVYGDGPATKIKNSTNGGLNFGKAITIHPNSGAVDPHPDITRLANGELMIVFNDGSDIHFMNSSDDGITWGNETTIINAANTLMDPSVVQAQNGVILTSYTDAVLNELWVVESTDNGASWSGARSVVKNVLSGNSDGNLQKMENGNLVISFSKGFADSNRRTYTRISKDNGTTWGNDEKTYFSGDAHRFNLIQLKNSSDLAGAVTVYEGDTDYHLILLMSELAGIVLQDEYNNSIKNITVSGNFGTADAYVHLYASRDNITWNLLYSNISNDLVYNISDGYKYVKVALESNDGTKSPIIKSININYNNDTLVVPDPPTNFQYTRGVTAVNYTWNRGVHTDWYIVHDNEKNYTYDKVYTNFFYHEVGARNNSNITVIPWNNSANGSTGASVTMNVSTIQEYTIAFISDARIKSFGTEWDSTEDFNAIKQVSPNMAVDAIVYVGDMENIDSQAKNIYEAYTNSTASDIPLFLVAGNHEFTNQGTADLTSLRNKFSSYSYSPTSGPNGSRNTTYSFDIGGMHAIVVNQYWDGQTDGNICSWFVPSAGPNSQEACYKYSSSDGGFIVNPLYEWVDGDLSNTTKPYPLVVMHEPAYPQNRHIGDSLDANTTNRDWFVDMLKNHSVVAMVVSHEHRGNLTNLSGILQANTGVSGGLAGDSVSDSFASLVFTVQNDTAMTVYWYHENQTWATPQIQSISYFTLSGTLYTRNIAQSISASNTILRTYTAERQPVQSVLFLGTTTRTLTAQRNPIQSLTITDTDLSGLVLSRSASQVLTMMDIVSKNGIFSRGISQGFSITDTVNRTYIDVGTLFTRLGTQSMSVIDTVSKKLTAQRLPIQTILAADSTLKAGQFIRDSFQTILITDTVNRTYIDVGTLFIRAVSQSFTTADAFSKLWTAQRLAAEIIILADSNDRGISLTREFSQGITLTDSNSRIRIAVRSISQVVSLIDTTIKEKITGALITITCPKGWCYVAMNYSSKTLQDLDEMFTSDTVQGWFNPSTQRPESHRSGNPYNSGVNVSQKWGYWYYFTSPENVSMVLSSNPTITLKAGWNLVGNYGNTSRNLSELKNSIGPNVTLAQYYNKTGKTWETSNSTLVPGGEAFYVQVSAQTNWSG